MVRSFQRVAIGVGLCLIPVLARPVFAATPRQTEVGSEEERLRRTKEREGPPRTLAPIELPPEPPPPAPPLDVAQIQVRRVAVEGSTLLPDKELAPLVASLVDRTVSLEEIRGQTQAITRWYRRKGYVTSRAFVPAQRIEQGLVRIRVIEGKVGQIKVEGNRYFSSELLTRQVKVQSGQILWLPRLEETLTQLNAHPDRKVKLVLTPGEKPETTDLIFKVTDRLPLHANYAVDTLGTKVTGEIRQSLLLAHGNLTGHDDQAVVRGMVSEFGGIKGGTFSYLRPLSPSGLTATLDVSGITSSIGGDLKDLLARGDALTLSPGLIIPWTGRTGRELEVVTGFDVKRIRTRFDDVTNSKDDLRVAHLGTNFLEQDLKGRALVSQELRWGIGSFLGGSHPEDPAASRAKAGGSFLRWIVDLARVQQGPFGTSLLLRGSAQLTTKRLVPAEQFRLGGFDTVRGYPEGEFLADTGYQTTVELRAPLSRLSPALASRPSLFNRLRQALLLVAFWDFAEGFLRHPVSTEDADMRLSGVGCGLRLRPTSESLLQADWGWAIGDRDREKDRPRLHLICRIGF